MKKLPHLRSSRRTAALILAGSIAALLVPRLSAQTTITYTNGQTDATAYSTSAPNDPTTLSLASGAATQSGILSGTGAVIINAGTGTLTLSAANTVSGTTTVSAGTLALGNVNALQNSTLNTGVSGTQAVTFTVAGTNTYNLGGLTGADALDIGGNTISVGANNADTTFSGQLVGTLGGLTKVGAGTLTKVGPNLTTGVTTIREGILSVVAIATKGGLSSSSAAAANLVFDGGTLRMTGNSVQVSTNRNFTINAGKTATFDITNAATNSTWTGASVATTGALTKTGAGTLTLAGANLHTGATTISAGTLALSGGAAIVDTGAVNVSVSGANLTLNAGETIGNLAGVSGTTVSLGANRLTTGDAGSTTFAGVISGAGGALTKQGAGTFTLSGANTFTGGTTVNAGTLLLSGANNMPATGTLQVNAGGNFSLADGTARATTTTAALNLASGANLTFDWNAGAVDTLTSTAAATTTGIVGIIINPTNAPSGTGLTLLSSSSGGLQTAGGTKYFLANNTNFAVTLTQSDTAVTIGGYTAVSAPATFYWQGNKVAGTNTAGVDNALAYSNGSASNWSATDGSYTAIGLTPGSPANVIFSAAGAVEQSTVLGADMAVNSVTFNNSAAVAIGGGNTLTLMSTGTGASSAIVVSATANANTAISSNVALGASQTWSVASGKNLAVSGTVSGGNSLTKDDAGTLTLTGANTYTGNTTVKAGTLKLDLSGSISNSAAIIVGDAGSTGTHLDVTTVNGGFVVVINQTLKGIGTIDGNTTILGTHAPGNSLGLQTVGGNLIYGTGSMVNLELGANLSSDTAGIRGVHFDAVDVTGALTIGTGVTSNLIFNGVGSAVDFADAFWTSDRSWLVYDAATLSSGSIFDTITATVDSLGGTLPASAFSWQQTGNDVFLKFTAPGGPNPVPEPTGVAIGLLCVGVAALRRRRR